MTVQVLEADLTWNGRSFVPGLRVEVTGDTITGVSNELPAPTIRLSDRALLPGFVNAHSHAFQRALRGHGETFHAGAGSFWSWREAMYGLVDSLNERDFLTWCRQAFIEMLGAGITTVGEFHYFHHAPGDTSYAYDDLVLQAASEAGIRMVLLNTYYQTGGIGQTLGPAQSRFATPGLDGFWKQLDRLDAQVDGTLQRTGVVAHSIRAVPLDELRELSTEARRRSKPLHMHVEEQPREIAECQDAYGRTPMRVILDTLPSAEGFVAVHCTHTQPDDMAEFLAAGGSVCVCPLTEANLGDGIPDVTHLAKQDNAISLGTDSNARISQLEEMRWLEYGQRLAGQARGTFVDSAGSVGARLINIGTAGGAAALQLPAGRISPGCTADFVAVNLRAAALEGATPDTLAGALALGADRDVIDDVCVAGRWRRS